LIGGGVGRGEEGEEEMRGIIDYSGYITTEVLKMK